MRHWNTKELWQFAMWLWEEKYFEYFLLTVHGTFWGLKFGQQLKIKWGDLIDLNGKPKNKLFINNTFSGVEISPFCQNLNKVIYSELKPDKNDLVYAHFRTKKLIDYKNLSKNLQRFAEKYCLENSISLDGIEPLKGTSFQIAWAIDVLRHNNYRKQAFVDLAEYMGKPGFKDIIEFTNIKPIENKTDIRFDLPDIRNASIEMETRERKKNAIRIKDFFITLDE